MNVSILTFDGFNELDSFISLGILSRIKGTINIQITSPSEFVTSMNGIKIQSQQPIEFANNADVVLFGSGSLTSDIAQNDEILSRFNLDPLTQLIGGQCSGVLLMSELGLLNKMPVSTDSTTIPRIVKSGTTVLEQPFYAEGNIATAGGCLSSQYLATWVICKILGKEAAKYAL